MQTCIRIVSRFLPFFGCTVSKSAKDGVFAPVLQPFVDNHVMAGAVALVADKDAVLHEEAVGYGDLATRRAQRTDDLFWIASITKPITGAAFMMLVDEGRVGLDEPVHHYIPEFRELKVLREDGSQTSPAHSPTIREILSHTAGLRFLNTKDCSIIDSVPLKTSIEHVLLEPLLWEPGTTYEYSNEGIDTAGRIIEIVSGMPYEQFLQERLFTPLGMVDTTFFPSAQQLSRLSTSYKAVEDEPALVPVPIGYLKHPLDRPDRYPAPGGGLFSTARDLARFGQMLINGGTFEDKAYLTPEAVRIMTTKQTPDSVENLYGIGIGCSLDGRWFGHGGAYKTNLSIDDGHVRIFMVQQVGDWATGDPGAVFDQAALKLHPAAAERSAALSNGVVGGQLPTAR